MLASTAGNAGGGFLRSPGTEGMNAVPFYLQGPQPEKFVLVDQHPALLQRGHLDLR